MNTTLRSVSATNPRVWDDRSHVHAKLTPRASLAVLIVGDPLPSVANGRCPNPPRSGTAAP